MQAATHTLNMFKQRTTLDEHICDKDLFWAASHPQKNRQDDAKVKNSTKIDKQS